MKHTTISRIDQTQQMTESNQQERRIKSIRQANQTSATTAPDSVDCIFEEQRIIRFALEDEVFTICVSHKHQRLSNIDDRGDVSHIQIQIPHRASFRVRNVDAFVVQTNPRFVVFSIPMYSALIPCLLYTSPSPRDGLLSRMPSSA
eukprot:TRINITY_DN7206_c0_g1_i1.p2 TRINITY_DN7206_c0_g1~~TRINITY_DN7206_c0_g1_i1.p2  ORF type:complete len:146 (-),score=10.45 TRINITY_DN7206_c0_g1_i1:53-490(-)